MAASSATHRRSASLGEIRALVGDIDAAKLEAILDTGATPAEVEQALAWAADATDVMGDLQRPLRGPVAAVYDILSSELPRPDDEG
jgi:hypothetical protein